MSLQSFPCSNATLCATALKERVLSKYGLSSSTCRFFGNGLNDTYKVTTDTKRYFLRVYTYRWRTLPDIEAELQLLKGLKRRGISVSAPVKRRDGSYITRLRTVEGTRYAVLFSEAPGSPLGWKNRDHARKYGRLVAEMHVCSDTMRLSHKRFHIGLKHLVDEPMQSIKAFRPKGDKDVAELVTLAGRLKERVPELLSLKKPHYGICHGDHHGGNAHIDEHGQITLFDFDCFGYGWRAYDIAVFLWGKTGFGNWSRKNTNDRRRMWNAFLKGYSEIRTLDEAELEAVKVFVPIRHIFLIGLHVDLMGKIGHTGITLDMKKHIDFVREWIRRYRVL
jgi:Ser/Thr protein kinase RdoA (MazF antagonist)